MARLVLPQIGGMGYEVLGLGVCFLLMSLRSFVGSCSVLLFPTLMGTGFDPLQELNAASGAWIGHLLLAEHPA